MALHSGFYDSYNGDRKYSASDFSSLFEGLITDGVYAEVGEQFWVYSNQTDNTKISIGTGRAWFNGIWVFNDQRVDFSITEPAPSTLNRFDVLVIEIAKTQATRVATFKIVKGPESVSPIVEDALANLTQTAEVYQAVIAVLERRANSGYSILGRDITPWTNLKPTTLPPEIKMTSFVTGILEHSTAPDIFRKWDSDIQAKLERLEEMAGNLSLSNIPDRSIQPIKLDRDYLSAGRVLLHAGSDYGDTLPDPSIDETVTRGRLFFKKVN